MKNPFTSSAKVASYLVMAVLVLVPFHAFLTVWGAALVGHYVVLRLWDEVLLGLVFAVACCWLVRDTKLRQWFVASLLVRLIGAYAVLTLVLGLVSYLKGDVSVKALLYGLLINLRFLAWFLAVLLTAQRSASLQRSWTKLLLIPAALVVVFGALQYSVLPHTFLEHFGYDAGTTIAPIETINHNAHYIRVQSTLRGANPLGAYLVIVIAALGTACMAGRRRLACVLFGIAGLFVLYASGSRSAWIGAMCSLAVIVWLSVQNNRQRVIFGSAAAVMVVVAAGSFLLLRNNVALQNAVLHTQDHSQVATTSNAAHTSALSGGLREVIRQPFGDGPGTAGPASEYNTTQRPRIAEDYYVQIAQEVGWAGLALFLVILILVGVELYQKVGTSPLSLALFASFIGIACINLLSHAWADDTLAFLWWGMAGIALARPVKTGKHEI